MSSTLSTLTDEYTAATNRAQRVCYHVCDVGLQTSEFAHLEKTIESMREAKRKAIAERSEEDANLFLGLESLARAVRSELMMWIAMKEQRPHDAWTALVDAQEYACLGLRTPAGHPGVAGYVGRLNALEKTLFPPLQFMSAGLTHDGGLCSICRKPFKTCTHVAGRIYCGRVCAEVEINSIRFDHGSLVEVPFDKRCYVTHYTGDDKAWYDVMTRLPTGEKEPDSEEEGWRARCKLLSTKAPIGVNI